MAMEPCWNTRFETDSTSDAASGKIDSSRMTRTAGQMNSHLASASERNTPRDVSPRRVDSAPGAGPLRSDPRGSICQGLSVDGEAGVIGRQLCFATAGCLVSDLVPAVGDLLHRLLLVGVAHEVGRDRLVESDLLVLSGLRDAQVEHHVGAVQAVLDG